MHILIAHPWIRQGGAENLSVYLAHHLQNWGHKIRVATLFKDLTNSPPEAEGLSYVTPSKILSHLCWRYRYFLYVLSFPLLFWTVLRHSKNAEVINAHNPPASWIAILVGQWRKIPVVWTCNEFAEQSLPRPVGMTIGKLLDRLLMKYADEIIVLSQKTQELVRERFGKEAVVIRAGVDPMFFSGVAAMHAPPKNGIGSAAALAGHAPQLQNVIVKYHLKNKFVLLTVGQIHRQKNQIVCLEALKKILPQIPEAVLIIVRDGPLKSFLEEKTREWGLEDHVRFVGFISNEELRDLYYACDVNLFPALDQSWGLTPFEALAAKKISIVSEDSGAAEVLRAENIGLVCPPTAEAFAKKILEVYRARRVERAKGRSQGTFRDRPDSDPGTEELGSKEPASAQASAGRLASPSRVAATPRVAKSEGQKRVSKFQKMTERGHQYVKQNLSCKSYATNTLQILDSVAKRKI